MTAFASVEEDLNAVQTEPDPQTDRDADPAFALHRGGKIDVGLTVPLETREDLSLAYTPGVARICTAIQQQPELAVVEVETAADVRHPGDEGSEQQAVEEERGPHRVAGPEHPVVERVETTPPVEPPSPPVELVETHGGPLRGVGPRSAARPPARTGTPSGPPG